MEECLIYFENAILRPDSVPSWEQWWAEKEELAATHFSLIDYVRLKHRHLRGARFILERLGRMAKEAPPDAVPDEIPPTQG